MSVLTAANSHILFLKNVAPFGRSFLCVLFWGTFLAVLWNPRQRLSHTPSAPLFLQMEAHPFSPGDPGSRSSKPLSHPPCHRTLSWWWHTGGSVYFTMSWTKIIKREMKEKRRSVCLGVPFSVLSHPTWTTPSFSEWLRTVRRGLLSTEKCGSSGVLGRPSGTTGGGGCSWRGEQGPQWPVLGFSLLVTCLHTVAEGRTLSDTTASAPRAVSWRWRTVNFQEVQVCFIPLRNLRKTWRVSWCT